MKKLAVKATMIAVTLLGTMPPPPAQAEAQSQLPGLLSRETFDKFFPHANDSACSANGFYTYDDLVEASSAFPGFANTGDLVMRKRDLAALLAHVSHETTGGWGTAPDGPHAWGLCLKEEKHPPSDYCDHTVAQWPCSPDTSYHGRGPIQMSWNYNYGPAGQYLGADLLTNPDLVATNAVISWKTALWLWMTPRSPKPSPHDVMVGKYEPTPDDVEAKRVPGFGLTTNIINGGLECGIPDSPDANDRIGFYKRFAAILDVEVGPNVECKDQQPY